MELTGECYLLFTNLINWQHVISDLAAWNGGKVQPSQLQLFSYGHKMVILALKGLTRLASILKEITQEGRSYI
jgi:hypothetical protein